MSSKSSDAAGVGLRICSEFAEYQGARHARRENKSYLVILNERVGFVSCLYIRDFCGRYSAGMVGVSIRTGNRSKSCKELASRHAHNQSSVTVGMSFSAAKVIFSKLGVAELHSKTVATPALRNSSYVAPIQIG
jgi:hypothetical protein